MLRRLSLLAALLISIFVLIAATTNNQPQTEASYADPGTIVYGLTLDPSGFDPHINQSAELGIVLRQVYDTLVYREPETGEFVPGLAQSWEISDDGLSYTFTLKQGVRFHDDTPFNAAAVAANLDRITNPEIASQKAIFLLGPYEGYDIIDDYTIRIRLTQPYSPLLDGLSQVYLGMASPSALSEYSPLRYQYHQVGTGPFIFEEYVPHDRIVLRRNPDYTWGPSFYTPESMGNVERIIYNFFTDPPTRILGLENGDAQVMGELLPADARALTGNSEIQLYPVAIPGQPLQFLMNTERFPTDQRSVRQALLFATNRVAIVDTVFQSFSPVAWGPLTASSPFYHSGMQGLYAHDIGQAESLLSTSGFEDTDNDGWLDFGGTPLQITIIVPPWGLIPEAAQLIQDQWREIGIQTILEPVPNFPTLREKIAEGEYNLVAFNLFGMDASHLNSMYLSGGVNNFTGFSSQELDNMLLEAVREVDPQRRHVLYQRAQEIIMQEALILPIRDYVNLNASDSRVRGLIFDPYGWFPLMYGVSFIDDEAQ